ncbi:sugar ABC transporter permease [candidate division KSB3 bacterium]|uniref:Sugar ABC transporter permease n=1 Tax=candidate division KSB3 bacterium TaxID=2044937 RepID=A0A2G6E2F7_9BACT|nr:MAG: sugar ABC transporter permease [candidate division KSB3 bacterium]PIE28848.1 MAG: sugar ABC transporter permease [candidate division KSB3 bacterium]
MKNTHSLWERLSTRNEIYLLAVVVVISIIFTMWNPNFLTLENIFDMLRSSAFIGILSVGVLIVLVSGGIDISFTATATVAQYVMALVLIGHHDVHIGLVLLIPLLTGTALGMVNGGLIYYFKAPPIIITIATMSMYYGALQYCSGGEWLYNFPRWFRKFPKTLVLEFTNADGFRYGLSVLTLIWLALILVAFVLLRYTAFGRQIFAVGGNLEAARRSGINILKVYLFVYGFMGFLSGIGAIVHAWVTQTVAPNALIGQEFTVITSVILGGASIFGGFGTLSGTFLGVALVALLNNGLTLMQVPAYWQKVAIGFILIISVSVTALQHSFSTRRGHTVDVDE